MLIIHDQTLCPWAADLPRDNDPRMFVTPERMEPAFVEAHQRLRFWVRHYRLEAGVSKNQLARLSGISKQGLIYMMSGDREPRMRSLIALALALDTTISALFADIPDGLDGDDW